MFQSLLKTADQLKIKGLCEVPEGNNGKDMVGAEVTPLPLPSPSSATPRRHFNKLRRMSATAKRKLDIRRQLYREQLQKQHQEEEHQRRLQQEQQQAQMIQTVVTTIHEPPQHNQVNMFCWVQIIVNTCLYLEMLLVVRILWCLLVKNLV